jgi:D-alanyl-D-alanine carboxypeptidase (penicillin-binding protein 5/6)
MSIHEFRGPAVIIMLNFTAPLPIQRLVPALFALLLAFQAQAQVPAAPEIGATSYVLVDFHSGETIAAKDADLPVEPASITKLMTSYVVFAEIEAGRLNLADPVRISEKAWRTGGSRMFVEVDTEVSVEDLLKGVIIQSGNDASVALAEHVAGSEEVFAQMMNAEAERLGMNNSNFLNATGLPAPEHLTTARDVAILARDLIARFPEFYRWYAEREFSYNGITQQNRNLLLARDPSVDGLKTGHTEAAGYCLATSAIRDGMRLVSVVMGTVSEDARASASQALLNYGFRFFETFKLYSAGDELASAEVWKGSDDELRLAVAEDLYVTIPRGRQGELAASLQVPSPAIAPFSAGQHFGELAIEFEGQALLTRPLLVVDEVPAAGWWGRTTDSVGLWFDGLFGGDD